MVSEFAFKIEKQLGVIKKYSKWSKELNLVSWGKNEAKFDIRNWDSNHENMKKGVTFSIEELETLKEILNSLNFEELKNSSKNNPESKIPESLVNILF